MSHAIPASLDLIKPSHEELIKIPQPKIVNCIMRFNLGNPNINLHYLANRLPGYAYQPKNFAAAKVYYENVNFLDFLNKHVICTGNASLEDGMKHALLLEQLYNDIGIPVRATDITHVNIVCHVNAGFEIELQSIIEEYDSHTSYTNDQFPGVCFYMKDSKLTFNLFVKGRVIITGSTSYETSLKAWWWLYTHVLMRHRRGGSNLQTNSAAYKKELFRRRTSISVTCSDAWARYARRSSGLLANSRYATLARTPGSSVMHTPITPRYGHSVESNTEQLNQSGSFGDTGTRLERMQTAFVGHQVECCFVTSSDSELQHFIRNFEVALIPDEETRTRQIEVLQPHVDAGCISSSALQNPVVREQGIHVFLGQLRAFIDATEPPPAFNSLIELRRPALEDLIDWETTHRVDLIRRHFHES